MALKELTLTAETQNPRLSVRREGAGPALVLIHGGMGSWNHWIAICRAAVPDLRFDLAPGAAHWAMYDSAAAINDLMLDFIPRSDD